MVSNCDDSLQDRRIVFRIWVDCAFQAWICFSAVHVMLDIHDFLENSINIRFGKIYLIEMNVSFFDTKLDCWFTALHMCWILMAASHPQRRLLESRHRQWMLGFRSYPAYRKLQGFFYTIQIKHCLEAL